MKKQKEKQMDYTAKADMGWGGGVLTWRTYLT